MGGQRLSDRLRRSAPARGAAGRPGGPQARLPHRARVFTLPPCYVELHRARTADRGTIPAGRRRRNGHRGHPRDDRHACSRSRREQAKAIGVFSFVAAAGASIGLLAGGVLTQALNWHWIFLVNLPIGIATAVLAIRLMSTDRGIGLGKGADVVGAVLITGALMLGVYTIVEAAATAGSPQLARRALGRPARRFRGAPGHGSKPAASAADLRSRNVLGRQRCPDADGGGHVRHVLPGHALHADGAGLHALQIGLGFLPVAVAIGTLSVGFSARLSDASASARSCWPVSRSSSPACCCSPGYRRRQYLTDLLPAVLHFGGAAACPSRR